jgi:hypothetical protein
MKLAILALEGCMHSAISGIADILSLSNYVMKLRGSPALIASRRQIATHSGIAALGDSSPPTRSIWPMTNKNSRAAAIQCAPTK